jgi:hypothetical protein
VSLLDTAEAQEEYRVVIARLASSPVFWVSPADVTITSIVVRQLAPSPSHRRLVSHPWASFCQADRAL